jgi:hypothetical protein
MVPTIVNLSPPGPLSVTAGTTILFTVSVFPNSPPPQGVVYLYDIPPPVDFLPPARCLTGNEIPPGQVQIPFTFQNAGMQYVNARFVGAPNPQDYPYCCHGDGYYDDAWSDLTEVDVDADTASHFRLDAPGQVRSGEAFSFTLYALDRFDNVATGYTGTVHFTSSDPAASLPGDYAFTPADHGVHAFTATLFTPGNQTITATDTVSGINGTTTILVVPGNSGRIDHSGGFAQHGDLAANGSAQFAGGVAHLTDNFGQAGSIFLNQPVPAASFGTAFTMRFHEGTQPNPADGITFTLQANSPTALGNGGGGLGYAGIPNSGAIKFDIYDNEGESDNSTGLFVNGDFPGVEHSPGDQLVRLDPNVINLRNQNPKQVTLTYSGTTLTETITDLFTFGTLTHAYAVNIPQMLGSNTAYVGFTAGTGGLYAVQDVLTWTGDFDPSGRPPATHLGTSVQYARPVAGDPISVTVTALDAANNPVLGYAGTVHLTSSDPQAILPPDCTFTTNDRGTHVFQVTLQTAGVQTVTVQSTAGPPVAGTATISIRAGTPHTLVVSGFPSPITAGDLGTFTVTAYDLYGNVAGSYADTVTFTSTDPLATLPADYMFSAGDGGSHTFQAVLRTTGTQAITATDTRLTRITGTQDGIVVNAPPRPGRSGFPVFASPVRAGRAATFTVNASGGEGSIATSYAGTATFTIADPLAAKAADYRFVGAARPLPASGDGTPLELALRAALLELEDGLLDRALNNWELPDRMLDVV